MIVNEIIEEYMKDAYNTIGLLEDTKNKIHVSVLYEMLESNNYVIKAMTQEFDEDMATDMVYLFDLRRNMFWKNFGYTRDIYSAAVFTLEEAKMLIDQDYNKNTKLVYFR